jgi:predicted CopG family antitoxin
MRDNPSGAPDFAALIRATDSGGMAGAARVSLDAARPVHLSSDHGKSELDVSELCAHCANVKNITVSVDDDTYRRARMKAAEQDTSVSALVKRFLTELARGESDIERLKREERELRARIEAFTAGERLSRQHVHERRA